MYTVYFTFYLGDKLPPYYIGSTTFTRLTKGYHGSVRSAKYGEIWKQEIKDHPELFVTFPIPDTTAETVNEILLLEIFWQQKFCVVEDPLFINQCYALAGFCSTSETALKAGETRKRNGTSIRSLECREKSRLAQIGKSRKPHTTATRLQMSKTRTGTVHSKEWNDNISKANTGKTASEETIQKLIQSHLGIKPTQQSIDKRAATIEENGGYNHSEETKNKIGKDNKGKKLGPRSQDFKDNIQKKLTGRTRSPEATRKMHETYARKRAEKLAITINN
jgi:hypothetical protein